MAEFSVTAGRDGSRSFGDHDDRWSRGGSSSSRSRGRVRFRGNNRRFNNFQPRGGRTSNFRGSRGGYRGRGSYGPNPRSRLDNDGDENMGDMDRTGGQRRFNPYGRASKSGYNDSRSLDNRKGPTMIDDDNRSVGGRLGLPFKHMSGDEEWFKITIPFGKNAEQEFILNALNSNLDTPFVPTCFHHEGNAAVFHVNERHCADAIRNMSKKITLPNGYKMTLIVKPSAPPSLHMGEKEIEKLKVVMSNRYDPASKALNLSSLHTDKDLVSMQLYMDLSRPNVMTRVVKVIQEYIPELVHLDLSSNKLLNLNLLAPLVDRTPDLRTLNLANNKLPVLQVLQRLKDWKIDWLTLSGNPLCDKFADEIAYTSAVRKMFPKVLKLDNQDLPPPITFDIKEITELPKTKPDLFESSHVKEPVMKFLTDFFTVYDSDNRASLAGAYHEQAVFSLSVGYNRTIKSKQPSFSKYTEQDRNLQRPHQNDDDWKYRLLRKGPHVVPCLSLLPKTSHDLNSFDVDCYFTSAEKISFSVQGVFKEVDPSSDKQLFRAFNRYFLTVPGGSGMLIMNDVLQITNASSSQVQQTALKRPAPTPSSSPVPQTSPAGNPFEGQGLTELQARMVTSFINDSGMNSEWSIKCLAGNDWQYEKAGQNFLQLKQEGKIPPEAFVKRDVFVKRNVD